MEVYKKKVKTLRTNTISAITSRKTSRMESVVQLGKKRNLYWLLTGKT
jgi:hypothetical protein